MPINVNPDWWKTLFDETYLLTDARSVCDDEITCREVDLICRLLPLHPHHDILDLCGGHGRHSFELYSRGFNNCTLVDFSTHLIDIARKRCEQEGHFITLLQSDARQTRLAPHSFDHVCIMGNSLGYIDFPDADHRILAEAHRLLRPGGWILVDIADGAVLKERFNPNAWHGIGDDIIVCRERELLEDRIHAREIVISRRDGVLRENTYGIRIYTPPELSLLLETAGFCNINLHTDFSAHDKKGDYGFMNHRVLAAGQKPGD
jgi:D-alanine-D-alanine ligase